MEIQVQKVHIFSRYYKKKVPPERHSFICICICRRSRLICSLISLCFVSNCELYEFLCVCFSLVRCVAACLNICETRESKMKSNKNMKEAHCQILRQSSGAFFSLFYIFFHSSSHSRNMLHLS